MAPSWRIGRADKQDGGRHGDQQGQACGSSWSSLHITPSCRPEVHPDPPKASRAAHASTAADGALSDGGAAAGPDPHDRSGLAPSLNLSARPACSWQVVRNVLLSGRPLRASPWTYGLARSAPGASIFSLRPPMRTAARGKVGLDRAHTGTPGVVW
jgi:hypothetical protein